MSMEIDVLSDRRLSSIAEWQRVIDADGFALQLSSEVSFDTMSGFLPAQLSGKGTGFECDYWDPNDIMSTYSEIDFVRQWKHALAFRWGGDMNECHSSWIAAAAYATATDGVVFDPEEGKIFTPAEAREAARDMERSR